MIYEATLELNPMGVVSRTLHFDAADFDEAVEKAKVLRDAWADDVAARKGDVQIISLRRADIKIVEVEL